MERNMEVASDEPEGDDVNVSMGMYELYTAIAAGISLSPGRPALETQRVLDRIVDAP